MEYLKQREYVMLAVKRSRYINEGEFYDMFLDKLFRVINTCNRFALSELIRIPGRYRRPIPFLYQEAGWPWSKAHFGL